MELAGDLVIRLRAWLPCAKQPRADVRFPSHRWKLRPMRARSGAPPLITPRPRACESRCSQANLLGGVCDRMVVPVTILDFRPIVAAAPIRRWHRSHQGQPRRRCDPTSQYQREGTRSAGPARSRRPQRVPAGFALVKRLPDAR
jgi:hypothetical protein